MNLFKRFRSYFIGFGLGIIMVMFIFRDKANLFTSWLPENRVLIDLYQADLKTTPKAACQLVCVGKDLNQIKEGFKDSTTVEFSQSKTHQMPREYCLMQQINGEPTCLIVALQDSTATINEVRPGVGVKCDCE